MAEMPEIKTLQLSRDDQGFGGGGEAPNALVPAAVTGAFLNATALRRAAFPSRRPTCLHSSRLQGRGARS